KEKEMPLNQNSYKEVLAVNTDPKGKNKEGISAQITCKVIVMPVPDMKEELLWQEDSKRDKHKNI
ncbi:7155_t:CDS:1, partial [Gigaspora margarita]